jgi:cytochrome c oxidase assembly protein subunit 15
LWTAFEYLRVKAPGETGAHFAKWAVAFVGLVYFQMLLGAIVAGLHAGLLYNTWPSMDGFFVPDTIWFYRPWIVNFTENGALAQFDHRMVGYAVGIAASFLWWAGRRAKLTGIRGFSGYLIINLTILQIVLGILTLLNQVPTILAAAHQATAVALFSAALWHAYELRGRPAGQAAAIA